MDYGGGGPKCMLPPSPPAASPPLLTPMLTPRSDYKMHGNVWEDAIFTFIPRIWGGGTSFPLSSSKYGLRWTDGGPSTSWQPPRRCVLSDVCGCPASQISQVLSARRRMTVAFRDTVIVFIFAGTKVRSFEVFSMFTGTKVRGFVKFS